MMKKLVFILLLSFIYLQSDAQAILPDIAPGTQLSYKFFLYGQTAAIDFTVESVKDSVLLNWSMRGYASGSYLISQAGLERGTKLNFIQPSYKTVLRLAPDETFAIISKSAFSELKRKKRFTYNNTTYVLTADSALSPFTIGGQALAVLHVSAVEEGGDLWILNNPDFPLICQFKNNPLGINFTIVAIK